MAAEINVVALVKGNERYVFLFDDENRTETLRQIGRYAANPELSFTWYDAAVVSQKVRQAAAPKEPERSEAPSRFRLPIFQERPIDWYDGDDIV